MTAREPKIQFHKEDESPASKNQTTSNMKLMNEANDWKVSVDLMTFLEFALNIIQREKRLGIVLRSDSKKSAFLMELIISREENKENAYDCKKRKEKENDTSHCMPTAWKRDGHVMWGLLWLGVVGFLDTQSFLFFFKNYFCWLLFGNWQCLIILWFKKILMLLEDKKTFHLNLKTLGT